MCRIVRYAYRQGIPEVIADVNRIMGREVPPEGADKLPVPTARELCGRLFFTCYMGTKNSSATTRLRAAKLAHAIGATHFEGDIDGIVDASVNWYANTMGEKYRPSFSGSQTQNLALQNVQARVRMVQSYLAAQLVLETQGRKGGLLVLGSANVDEGLRGFLTKVKHFVKCKLSEHLL